MAIQQQQSADLTLLQAIEMVAKDKGIDKTRLVKTVEEAILKAAQSVFGPNRELEARFNEDSGQVDLFQYMTVVDDVADDDREIAMEDAQRLGLEAEMGEELGFQIFWHPSDAKKAADQDKDYGDILRVKQARQAFGRIAAQTAKQVLIQRVRDEERDLIFNEFKDRKGSFAGSRRAITSSWTSGAPRGSCPSASRRRGRRIAPATAWSRTSRT
jgi:N utilization substance protein A